MNLEKAVELKYKFENLTGKDYPLDQNDLTIQGLFIAPSNPNLFDEFINKFWREYSNDEELFIITIDTKLIKCIISNEKNTEVDVYIKLELKQKNDSEYFLFDKLSHVLNEQHLDESDFVSC